MDTSDGHQVRWDMRRRVSALRTALLADAEVVQEHAHWWNPGLESRVRAAQPSLSEREDAATSLWATNECNRVVGQGLSEDEGELRADLAMDPKVKKLDAWGSIEAFGRFKDAKIATAVVNTRRALTSELMDGEKGVKARLVAEGYQGPNVKGGTVDTTGCVSRSSSHTNVTSLGAIKNGRF